MKGLFTNPVTGETFGDHEGGHGELDLSTEVLSIARLNFLYHSPGEGLQFPDVGRRIFDVDGNLVFSAGPTDFEEEASPGSAQRLAWQLPLEAPSRLLSSTWSGSFLSLGYGHSRVLRPPGKPGLAELPVRGVPRSGHSS